MCFYVSDSRPKLATKDIHCFKLFKIKKNGEISSPMRYCKWTPGIVQTSLLVQKAGRTIDRGLHSFIDVHSARNYEFRCPSNILLKVVIPAGAYYYKNDTQYVSNELVIMNLTPVDMNQYGKRKTKK